MKLAACLLFLLSVPFWCFPQGLTNVGTDFEIAFPPNASSTATLKIFISSNYSTNGTISSAFAGVDQSFTVTPGIITQLTVPTGVSLFGGVENKGIRIIAADPISVYGLNRITANTDAYMALPVTSLGTDYRVLAYKTTLNNNGSALSVAATQNGTIVTIFNHQTGATSVINLDEGQTYFETATMMGEDLTGSSITSNYPVAVYGSAKSTQIPTGCFFADHIVEQMFPVSAWGKKFITVPTAGRDGSGDIFRILANENGTDISINGTLSTTIGAGDYYETNLSGYNSVITSRPTLVAQYAKSTQCAGNITGDPFMMLISPREQFLTDYTISTVSGFTSHWVNIVAPSYAIGAIYQDGVMIPAGSFIQVGATGFYGAQISVMEGSHTFLSNFPFGVVVYGWTNVDSYGYPGGGSLSPVGTVNSVTISPPNASGILNVTSVCFTAHVEDDFNSPVAGVLVTFNISGINPVTGTGFTDAAGNAQYCYTQTGTIAGMDEVYAEIFGFTSTISTVDWTFIPTCTNPTDGGSIGSAQTGCGNYTPNPIQGLGPPSGQTGILEYKWQQSIMDAASGFNDIPGSNSAGYSPGNLSQTTWYRRVARVDCMADWTGSVFSNVVKIMVEPELPVGITISTDTNPFCAGSPVTLTANAVNGGPAPLYQWHVNGVSTGPDSDLFTFLPTPGDQVSCQLASNANCAVNNPATSNTVILVLNTNYPASVSITANPNPFCTGSPVQFTATGINGGPLPAYQWVVNGMPAGPGTNSFNYSPQAGDMIQCTMTSNLTCVTSNPAISNNIAMTSLPVPLVSLTPCFDVITMVNARPIQLKGGLPPGGTFSGPGVNQATGIFTPALAGAGTKTITYTATNAAMCSNSATLDIVVYPASSFMCGGIMTDIRDNQPYPTVQIGSQCWMQTNLDFGISIDDFSQQTDNCLVEKYIRDSLFNIHYSIFYQWDELMHYQTAAGSQGLCPPGWHVPTSAEWDQLLLFYNGPGLAGGALKDDLLPNGFQSHQTGLLYLNNAWAFTTGLAAGTMYWTSTSSSVERAVARGLNEYNMSVSRYEAVRGNGFSVRCLKD